ncbi:MAG: TIGR02996 domain-containing protein [Archangium sp.]
MSVAHLEKARAALGKRDFESALATLLLAWRDEQGTVLADLIDAVSRRAAEGRASLLKKPLAAQWVGWNAVVKQKDPADFERLVAVPMPRKWLEAAQLINQLVDLPADPRLGRYLQQLLRAKTMYEIRSDKMYGGLEGYEFHLLWQLANLGDARQADFVLQRMGKSNRGQHAHRSGPSIREVAAELKKRAQPKGKSLELATAMLAEFGARPDAGAGDAKSLLTKIYEHPDDLALRAVYADALTSQGDERGEFISLQLGGKRTARETKLIKSNLRGWAGELDPFFRQEDRHFENGFFAGGTAQYEEIPKKALSLPEWKLVTRLGLVTSNQQPTAALLSKLPSLRSLEFYDEKFLKHLLDGTWPLTSLHFRLDDSELGLAEKLTTKVFPKLTRLIVGCPKPARAFSWLARVPLFKQLTSIRVEGLAAPASGWWKKLEASELTSLELESRGWALEFTRDEKGSLSKLTVEPIWGSKTDVAMLVEVLATGPVNKPSSIQLKPHRRARHITSQLLAKALR